jgi:hypothetical protein
MHARIEIICCALIIGETPMGYTIQSKMLAEDTEVAWSNDSAAFKDAPYAFAYKGKELSCRVWYDDSFDGAFLFDLRDLKYCDELFDLFDLVKNVERLIRDLPTCLSDATVRRVLCKHLRAMNRVKKLGYFRPSMFRHPISPVEMEMAPKEEYTLDALQKQQSKETHQAATANGKPDAELTTTVTEEMVKAKMQEKTHQAN